MREMFHLTVVTMLCVLSFILESDTQEDMITTYPPSQMTNATRPPKPSKGGMTDALKKAYIDLHNFIRRQVSPGAANMLNFHWNDQLARNAQSWVDHCEYKYGIASGSTKMSQNLYMGTDPGGLDGLLTWVDLKSEYDFDKNKCLGSKCVTYKKIVWAKTNQIGCGLAHCPAGTMVCCNYSPAVADYMSDRPYIAGHPCSLCDSQRCLFGLCDASSVEMTQSSASATRSNICITFMSLFYTVLFIYFYIVLSL